MQVIIAKSPDLNPIENLFHIVRKKRKQKSCKRTLHASHGTKAGMALIFIFNTRNNILIFGWKSTITFR